MFGLTRHHDWNHWRAGSQPAIRLHFIFCGLELWPGCKYSPDPAEAVPVLVAPDAAPTMLSLKVTRVTHAERR